MTSQLDWIGGAHEGQAAASVRVAGYTRSRPPPRARNSDPVSSHVAAAAITRSGVAQAQAQRVLAALQRFPGSTSAELAKSAQIERYAVARRLPELREEGLVDRREPTPDTKPCRVGGKRACRWYPA